MYSPDERHELFKEINDICAGIREAAEQLPRPTPRPAFNIKLKCECGQQIEACLFDDASSVLSLCECGAKHNEIIRVLVNVGKGLLPPEWAIKLGSRLALD